MTWLEVLVEGVSDVPAVREVLQRKFNFVDGVHFRIHPHRGKGKLPANPLSEPQAQHRGLLDQLPAKLRGFGKSLPKDAAVLVVVDVDDVPCHELLAQLNRLVASLPNMPRVLVRLAIEETESWFIADVPALEAAFPGKFKKGVLKGIQPDAIVGAWEMLARSLGHETKNVGPGAKSEWAKKIAPHLNLEKPNSPSLRKFIDGVGRLTAEKPQ